MKSYRVDIHVKPFGGRSQVIFKDLQVEQQEVGWCQQMRLESWDSTLRRSLGAAIPVKSPGMCPSPLALGCVSWDPDLGLPH